MENSNNIIELSKHKLNTNKLNVMVIKKCKKCGKLKPQTKKEWGKIKNPNMVCWCGSIDLSKELNNLE